MPPPLRRAALLTLLTLLSSVYPAPEKPLATVKFLGFSDCPDSGTDEMRFTVRPNEINGVVLYSGSFHFDYPLNNKMQAVAEVSRWMDNRQEWGRTMHVQRIPDACQGTCSLVPQLCESLATCACLAGICPVPAGHYQISDCAVRIGPVNRKLPTGRFRVTTSLKNATHVLGCFNMVAEVFGSKQ